VVAMPATSGEERRNPGSQLLAFVCSPAAPQTLP
jgi:hypothetical protein